VMKHKILSTVSQLYKSRVQDEGVSWNWSTCWSFSIITLLVKNYNVGEAGFVSVMRKQSHSKTLCF
jgi:hypothetical protein